MFETYSFLNEVAFGICIQFDLYPMLFKCKRLSETLINQVLIYSGFLFYPKFETWIVKHELLDIVMVKIMENYHARVF